MRCRWICTAEPYLVLVALGALFGKNTASRQYGVAVRVPKLAVAVAVAALGLTGCAAGNDAHDTAPSALTAPAQLTSTRSRPVFVPQTTPGIVAGPGVTDESISLGAIVAPELDRGFSDGMHIWSRSVNEDGGICGRRVELSLASDVEAYPALARSSLGLITLVADHDAITLAKQAHSDGIMAFSPRGATALLDAGGVIPLGTTPDHLVINALAYLVRSGTFRPGTTIGLYRDATATADDIQAAMTWWTRETGATLAVYDIGDDVPDTSVIVAAAAAKDVAALLTHRPEATVLTTMDGYQPDLIAPVDAGRLLIMSPTPAAGANHPVVAAVTQAAASAPSGPQLLAGYATAEIWGRTLVKMCQTAELTRSAAIDALTATPTPPESLLGAINPALVVREHQPATLASAMAKADPADGTGLVGLTVLQVSTEGARYQR